MRELNWIYLGRRAYPEMSRVQEELRVGVREGRSNEHLLLLEHAPVFTLGRNADPADVVADPEWLTANGIGVHRTNRGGKVTYHGPGQLVGYPIINLDPDRRDIRRYVHDLQRVLVRTLSKFGIEAEARREQALIGVWVGPAKIASIGVHLSRWITTHGFALNVTTDLTLFEGIVACGIDDVRMASMETILAASIDLEEVAVTLAKVFADVFDRRLNGIEKLSLPGLGAS